jgi:hypothetical protein
MKHAVKKRGKSDFCFVILALLNSIWIFYVYLSVAHIGVFEPAKLSRVLLGTAERPYAYRVLVPFLTKIVAPIVPDGIIRLFSGLPYPLTNTFEVLRQGGYGREAAVVLTLMFLSLVGFAYAEKNFLKHLSAGSVEQFLLPFFAQLLILPFSLLFGYYYDLTQILLVALTLNFMLQARWTAYLVLFALASLNKETTSLLVVVFVIYHVRRLPRKKFLELLGMQTILYALVRGSLLYLYRNNPGTQAFFTLRDHYRQYAAQPALLLYTLLFFIVLGILIARSWKQQHPFLQASLALPLLLLALFFISGMPMEFRVFLDALPVLALLLVSPKTQVHATAAEVNPSNL